MTLANCERLLRHFERGRGTPDDPRYVPPNPVSADAMRAHMKYRAGLVARYAREAAANRPPEPPKAPKGKPAGS